MKALSKTDVPVPHMYALCEDESVIGTSFYVMEYLAGRVFRESIMPVESETERRAVYASLAENLAKLHKVDYQKVGLGDFGRPGNYFERQIGAGSSSIAAPRPPMCPQWKSSLTTCQNTFPTNRQ
jgi:aminoglycoside phosphotransferase (APT) family kinase protein